ncbi:MAG: (deoxy)nucleoside triphosphate pyrophosphohydrolase [Jatrophihabitantaceae bacterium]
MKVVGAVLVQDGRLLAARRVSPPGWEFPGGKVDSGETPQGALERECREELGIDVRAERLVGTASDARIELQVWHVALLAGTPRAMQDHHELRWVAPAELDGLDWLPIDRELLAVVAALL